MAAALGSHPFDHYLNNYMASNNPPHGQGSRSGSESGSASGNYSIPLGDAQSDQPPSFDLSDFIMMEPGVGLTNFILPQLMQGGPVGAPLMHGGMSAPQMESAMFQAAQNSAGINAPTSSGGARRVHTIYIKFLLLLIDN